MRRAASVTCLASRYDVAPGVDNEARTEHSASLAGLVDQELDDARSNAIDDKGQRGRIVYPLVAAKEASPPPAGDPSWRALGEVAS